MKNVRMSCSRFLSTTHVALYLNRAYQCHQSTYQQHLPATGTGFPIGHCSLMPPESKCSSNNIDESRYLTYRAQGNAKSKEAQVRVGTVMRLNNKNLSGENTRH
jgi:hypothetical protein